MFMMGGGVGKGVDGVADSISKIAKDLEKIDSLMGKIGKKTDKLKIGGGGTGGTFSNAAGGHLSSGNGLFPTGANFGTGMMPTQPPKPSFGTQLAKTSPGGALVATGIAATTTAVWNSIPDVADATSQRQAMFSATLDHGPGMPNYQGLKKNMMTAFGGYASSSTSQENVVSMMGQYGMSSRNGISSAGKSFMGETSALSLLTGRSQEQMAALKMSMAGPKQANQMLLMGVQSANPDGTPRDVNKVVADIVKQTFGGRTPTQEQMDRELRADGYLRRNLSIALGPEGAQSGIEIARAMGANGGKEVSLSQMQKMGLLDEKRNPNARLQQYTGTRSETTTKYSDDLIAGWSKALDAAEAVEKVLQDLEGVLGAAAYGKGVGQGILGTPTGSGVVSGIDQFLVGGGGAVAGSMLLGRLGKTGLGARLGLSGGAAAAGEAAVGRSAAGSLAGRALASPAVARAGMMAPLAVGAGYGLDKARDAAFNRWGANEHSSAQKKNVTSGMRVLSDMAIGATMGLLIGGPVGMAVGAAGGFAYGAYGAHKAGNDTYGYSHAGQGGTGSSTGTRGAEKGAGKPPTGAGASTAVLRAYREIEKPSRSWYNKCQMFVEYCSGRTGQFPSARAAWERIPHKLRHTDGSTPPPGAWVFWDTRGVYGHVALSLGGGKVASNDILRKGKIDVVTIGQLTSKWGAKYLGWTPSYIGGTVGVGTDKPGDGQTEKPDASAGKSDSGTATTVGKSSGTSESGSSATTPKAWSAGADGQVAMSSVGGLSINQFSISSKVKSDLLSTLLGASTTTASGEDTSGAATAGEATSSASTSSSKAPQASSKPGPGKGVQRWTGVAKDAMKAAGLDEKYLPLLLQRMQVESGGNPNAINKWDINAKNGVPSQGLMQVIPPTFDAFAGPYKSRGLRDPFANIYAAIKYTQSRYGEKGIEKAWGGKSGYSKGAWRIGADEDARIHTNEMILPATIAEAVRTQIAKQNAGQGGGGGKREVTINFQASGVLGYDLRELVGLIKDELEKDDELTKIGRA